MLSPRYEAVRSPRWQTPEAQRLSQMCGILGKLTGWHFFRLIFKACSRLFSSVFGGDAKCSADGQSRRMRVAGLSNSSVDPAILLWPYLTRKTEASQ